MDFIQPAQEESEAEVRRVDQDNINKFARLNARLHEVRDERDLVKVQYLGSISLVSFCLLSPTSANTLFLCFSLPLSPHL